jgi:zinc protease
LKRVAGTYLQAGRLTQVVMNPKGMAKTEAPSLGRQSANPDFEEIRLSNGMRVLLRANPSLPNLNIRLVGRAGGFLEPENSRGITQLMATMLTRDTEKRSSAKVAGLIESAGGSFSEFAGDNSFGLSCEVLPEDSNLALEVLSDALLRPAFKPATVRRERDAQLAGIREASDDIVHAASYRLRGLFFGHHPLAVDSDGTLEMVGRTQAKDLRGHRDQLVRAGNLVVAVSGAFEREELLGCIEEAFSGIPKGEVDLTEHNGELPVATGHHVLSQDREQVIVYHSFPGPGILSKDFMASEVLDEIFSGMASRLFERVREEQGLAYFVRSGRILAMNEGMFYFVAGTSPSGYRQVISELCGEVDRAREGGISLEELRRSQVRLKAGRRMAMQTNSACSIQAALNAIYGLPVNDWRNYDAKIDAISLEDLQGFARARFTPENRLELLAGAVGEKRK